MKKFVLYGFIILLVFNLLSRLWTSITLDEDEEVSMFIQKVEMLESSDDYYHVSNTSNEYLNFLEENIEWFSAEQSKKLAEDINSLRSYAQKKIDSIDQATKENEKKKELEERKKKELEEEKITKEKEREKAKEKSMKDYCFTKKPYVFGSSPSLSYQFFKSGKFVMFANYGNRSYEGKYKYKNDKITLYKTWISPQETETLDLIRNCTTLKDISGYWWNGD